MQKTRFDRIGHVLNSLKRAEAARLKAKLTEAALALSEAHTLRQESASGSSAPSIAEMQFQSAHQRHREARARELERLAAKAEQEVKELRGQLALTLARQQAADALAHAEALAEKAIAERRAEW